MVAHTYHLNAGEAETGGSPGFTGSQSSPLTSESEIHGYPEEQHSELIPDFHTCAHTHIFVHLYTHKHVHVGTYTEEERRGGGREGGRKGESVSGH